MTRRLALLLLLCVPACSDGGLLGPSGSADYSLTGSAARVDITYQNSSGGTSQVSNATLPWTYSLSGLKTGDFLYVSAQITSTSGGSLVATINRNGKYFQSATANGFASIATASGSY